MNRVSGKADSLKVECPCCHAPRAFGPRRIMGQYWTTRCSKCRYYTDEPLPTITKKIIYLDQCFLSHVLSAREPLWRTLGDRLRLLMGLDLVVCPYSQVHYDESLLAESSRDDLKALYRELSGGAKARENMLRGFSPELADLYRGLTSAPGTPPGNQPGVRLVHWLTEEVRKARPNETDPISVVEQFFQSEVAMTVPFLYITSHLWAALKDLVRGSNRRPRRSDNYDIVAIAHYAPYCDAMFLDKGFRALASQGNVDVRGRYCVRLFSANTADTFMEYLTDLLYNMPSEHREALKAVHPELAHAPLSNPENIGE